MTTELGQVFQICQAAIIAEKYAMEMSNQTLPAVNVVYPATNFNNCCYYKADGTPNSLATIYITTQNQATGYPSSYASWDTVMHEYGHHVQYFFGITGSHGGTHWSGTNMADHYYTYHLNTNAESLCQKCNIGTLTEEECKEYGVTIAWTEAWATVFGTMAQDYYKDLIAGIESVGDDRYTAYNQLDYSLETIAKSYRNGEACENAVSGVLYDLFDDNDDESDTLSMGHQWMWNTVMDSQAKTFSQYINYLLENNLVDDGKLGALLTDNRIAPYDFSERTCQENNAVAYLTWSAKRFGKQYGQGEEGEIDSNTEFQLIFATVDGEEILKISTANYDWHRLTRDEWHMITEAEGSQYKWRVALYEQTGAQAGYASGPYYSSWVICNKPTATSIQADIGVTEAFIGNSSRYHWFKFTAKDSGIYSFYTDAEETLRLSGELFDEITYGILSYGVLAQDFADKGESNFQITYQLAYNQTIYIRVSTSISALTGQYTLYVHEEEHVHSYTLPRCTQYSAQYHRRFCSCGAKILEAHLFSTTNALKAKCIICGYVATGLVDMIEEIDNGTATALPIGKENL
jgi:hypothetical protein